MFSAILRPCQLRRIAITLAVILVLSFGRLYHVRQVASVAWEERVMRQALVRHVNIEDKSISDAATYEDLSAQARIPVRISPALLKALREAGAGSCDVRGIDVPLWNALDEILVTMRELGTDADYEESDGEIEFALAPRLRARRLVVRMHDVRGIIRMGLSDRVELRPPQIVPSGGGVFGGGGGGGGGTPVEDDPLFDVPQPQVNMVVDRLESVIRDGESASPWLDTGDCFYFAGRLLVVGSPQVQRNAAGTVRALGGPPEPLAMPTAMQQPTTQPASDGGAVSASPPEERR